MKKVVLFIFALVVSLLWNSLYAEGDSSSKQDFIALDGFNFEFEMKKEDANAYDFSWNDYEGSDFLYYKFLVSATDSNPMYPEDPVYTVWMNASDDTATFWAKESGTYYARVCIITMNEETYQHYKRCSNVIRFEHTMESSTEKEYGEKEYEYVKEYEHKASQTEKETPQSEEKNDTVKVQESTKTPILGTQLQAKIDGMLETFFEKVEEKNWTDKEVTEKLNQVNEALEGLKKTYPSLNSVIDYMVSKISAYALNYDPLFGEIENILQ